MVRKEKKCNLCTRIKVLPISPVRTVGVFQIWLYAHYELKCCAINICPVNNVGADARISPKHDARSGERALHFSERPSS